MTKAENKTTLDVLQEQTLALIQQEPTNDDEARRRAELLIVQMHFALAYAHRHLAFNENDQAEAFFDLAEQTGCEGFNVSNVHVARYTEDTRPYKLALGAILSAGKNFKANTITRVGDFVRLSLCEVLCRIQGIDPDEMRELYRKWQAEPDLKAGEVH